MAVISEQEKLRRRACNQDILGTHAMEGLFPDVETSSLLKQFEEGYLDREQLSAALETHAHKLAARHRSLSGAA